MGRWLFLLFTVVPLVELYLLLWLGDRLGFAATVALVLFTGVVGATLAKLEGLRVMREWQEALGAGKMPTDGVMGGLLILVGGVLLVTPGVLTDLTGFLLLIPPTRRLVMKVLRRRLEAGIASGNVRVQTMGGFGGFGSTPGRPAGRGQVIDVEGEELTAPVQSSVAAKALPEDGSA